MTWKRKKTCARSNHVGHRLRISSCHLEANVGKSGHYLVKIKPFAQSHSQKMKHSYKSRSPKCFRFATLTSDDKTSSLPQPHDPEQETLLSESHLLSSGRKYSLERSNGLDM